MALQNISIRNLRGQGDAVDSGGINIGTRNNGSVSLGSREQIGVRNSGGTQVRL